MLAAARAIWREEALFVAAALLVLYGAVACTIAPYQSLLAIETFGLSHLAYAVVLVAGALVFVTTSITGGILADQSLSRRTVALASTAAYALGAGLMWLVPGKAAFILAHAVLLPTGGTIFGQCFALARLGALGRPAAEQPSILAIIRALFAAPFVVVLPVWSVVLGMGADLTVIYPVLFALGLMMIALILRAWPQEGRDGWHDPKSGLSFAASLGEFADGRVLGRVLLLGVLAGATGLYMTLVGLVFTSAGRDTGDVALYVGFVAGAEVPFMLAVPFMQRFFRKTALIAVGIAIYAVHLALMPFLAGTEFVWGLILFAALGGAAILTLPIAYLQDLMADRPGAGASLIAVQRICGDATCAAAFAIGTALSGYGFAAVLGAMAAVTSGLFLWLLDRR